MAWTRLRFRLDKPRRKAYNGLSYRSLPHAPPAANLLGRVGILSPHSRNTAACCTTSARAGLLLSSCGHLRGAVPRIDHDHPPGRPPRVSPRSSWRRHAIWYPVSAAASGTRISSSGGMRVSASEAHLRRRKEHATISPGRCQGAKKVPWPKSKQLIITNFGGLFAGRAGWERGRAAYGPRGAGGAGRSLPGRGEGPRSLQGVESQLRQGGRSKPAARMARVRWPPRRGRSRSSLGKCLVGLFRGLLHGKPLQIDLGRLGRPAGLDQALGRGIGVRGTQAREDQVGPRQERAGHFRSAGSQAHAAEVAPGLGQALNLPRC